MGRADYLQLGDWNVQCYQCGRKRKGSTMKKHWQGYWVCPEHWEPRHPQDFVRNIPDDMTPPWSQPQPAPNFIPQCTPNQQSALAGYATPGCVIAGFINPAFNPFQKG